VSATRPARQHPAQAVARVSDVRTEHTLLDNEPTSDTTNASTTSSTNDRPGTAAGAGSGQAPPSTRRRRATKASAAPTAAAAPVAEPGPAADTSDTATEAEAPGAADGSTAPVKRTRKAAAKKAAPRKRTRSASGLDAEDSAVAAELATPAEAVVAPVEEDPLVVGAAEDDVATVPALVPGPDETPAESSAPRGRRKRIPAVVTFQAPVEDEPAAGARTDVEQAEGGQAGEQDGERDGAPTPRRRRRAGTAGAIAPAAFLAAPDAPVPARVDAASLPADADAGPDGTASPDLDDDDEEDGDRPRRRRRGRRGRGRRPEGDGADETGSAEQEAGAEPAAATDEQAEPGEDESGDEASGTGTRRRRRRRRSGTGGAGDEEGSEDQPAAVVHVREPRQRAARGTTSADEDGVRGITGSTRMAAKRARRQEGRDSGRRRAPVLSEAEFLARREAVERTMVVRQQGDRTQIAVLEDGILVEHYVTKASAQSYAGNVYLGRVQNVLPSMEAAFVDIGKGRNAVLYAGEVNYAAQAGGQSRKIEQVLKSGNEVLAQVTKDPIGHKGARLTSQITLPGRYLVYVPEGSMTGISRKLPENERTRLKAILKKVVPDDAGVIIRTAAEGVGEEEIARDVRRLQAQWEVISTKAAKKGAPVLLHAEPDLLIRVVRDVFNEDFTSLVVQGESEWETIREYVEFVAPDLAPRLHHHDEAAPGSRDVFAEHRVDEQLAKALDRKVWLPSGGSLVIDRTEAMLVVDVNTGKYVGKGGNLEETVTRNNLEAAEEIARQLRLRDLGGIIVVDFIDMVLESNRDLVVRRLVECLGRDRTKHQIAEVTSLGLVQMTRKRVGQGLLESFSETCETCGGRGVIVHAEPVDAKPDRGERLDDRPRGARGGRGAGGRESDNGTASGDNGAASGGNGAGGRGGNVAVEPATAADSESVGSEAAEGAPKRRRRSGRSAASAEPSLAAGDPSAEVAELLADQPTPAQEDLPVVPEIEGAPALRRRRRATSRPAGPPVPTP